MWAGATLLAVLLAWYGVRDVLRAAVFDRPGLIPPVGAPGRSSPPPPSSAGPSPAATTSSPAPHRSPHPAPPSRTATATATAAGNISSYTSRGGRVALAMTATDVRLVSATPDPGFQVAITHNTFLLRVDFTNGPHTSSIIATWYEHAPTVQVYEQS